MSITLEAIYEDGLLRPLSPLALPEHTRVRVVLDDLDEGERGEWLIESQRRLNAVRSHSDDDVFNELLAP